MLRIELVKLQTTGLHCDNPNCKKDSAHMINILGNVWYIRTDTTVAVVTLKGSLEYYCRGCIDELFKMVKTKLDPKLWAFH